MPRLRTPAKKKRPLKIPSQKIENWKKRIRGKLSEVVLVICVIGYGFNVNISLALHISANTEKIAVVLRTRFCPSALPLASRFPTGKHAVVLTHRILCSRTTRDRREAQNSLPVGIRVPDFLP